LFRSCCLSSSPNNDHDQCHPRKESFWRIGGLHRLVACLVDATVGDKGCVGTGTGRGQEGDFQGWSSGEISSKTVYSTTPSSIYQTSEHKDEKVTGGIHAVRCSYQPRATVRTLAAASILVSSSISLAVSSTARESLRPGNSHAAFHLESVDG
jgi:hypothetical protein